MKTIYLPTGEFSFNSLDELRDEFKKSNIIISPLVYIGDCCVIRADVQIKEYCKIEDLCAIKEGCIIESGCRLERAVVILANSKIGHNTKIKHLSTIGTNCNISAKCYIGERCIINNNCHLDECCRIGAFAQIKENTYLKKSPIYTIGLYKYHTCGYFSNGIPYIQMGCYLRSVDEWEKDFWNNPNEFFDPSDPESKRRWNAFKVTKKLLIEENDNSLIISGDLNEIPQNLIQPNINEVE